MAYTPEQYLDRVKDWLDLLECEDISASELADPFALSGFFYILRCGGKVQLNGDETPFSKASDHIRQIIEEHEKSHAREYDTFNQGMSLGMRFSEFKTFCDHEAERSYGLNLQNTPYDGRQRYFEIHKEIKYASKRLRETYPDEMLDQSGMITLLYEEKSDEMDSLLFKGDYEGALRTWDFLFMILNYYESHENVIELEFRSRQDKEGPAYEDGPGEFRHVFGPGDIYSKAEDLRRLRLDINKRRIDPKYGLGKRMELAVVREDYEAAAGLRDEIAQLP